VREARELKLDVIREYFDMADWDGIELDWSATTYHFAPGTEYDNRGYLTEFTREVRKITQQAARIRPPGTDLRARAGERCSVRRGRL